MNRDILDFVGLQAFGRGGFAKGAWWVTSFTFTAKARRREAIRYYVHRLLPAFGQGQSTVKNPCIRRQCENPAAQRSRMIPVWQKTHLEKSKNNPLRRNRTIRARLFGHKIRCQSGQSLKILRMPVRGKVRSEKSP